MSCDGNVSVLGVSIPDMPKNRQSPPIDVFVSLSVVRSPELVLFGESLVEGEQREMFRDPGLGMAFVAGVYTIHFTTIFSDYDLVTRIQGIAVGLVRDCDISPGNFESAGSPGERAGIKDGRNWDP